MGTLRKDMIKRIDQRLYTWRKDAITLYEMAGIDPADCYADVVTSLITIIADCMRIGSASPKDAEQLFYQALLMIEEHNNKKSGKELGGKN